MTEEGTVTVVRENKPNGGSLVRITRADKRVRISLQLLELIEAGYVGMLGSEDTPVMRVEDGWVYLNDDYAHQSCYRLGDLDDTGRARWMEKL